MDKLSDLEKHLESIHSILRKNGICIADLVVDSPNCLGICNEWSIIYGGSKCRVFHMVETIREDYFIESLDLVCDNGEHYKSRSKLYLSKRIILEQLAEKVGFKHIVFLKPFTLQQEENPRGRTFMILVK